MCWGLLPRQGLCFWWGWERLAIVWCSASPAMDLCLLRCVFPLIPLPSELCTRTWLLCCYTPRTITPEPGERRAERSPLGAVPPAWLLAVIPWGRLLRGCEPPGRGSSSSAPATSRWESRGRSSAVGSRTSPGGRRQPPQPARPRLASAPARAAPCPCPAP